MSGIAGRATFVQVIGSVRARGSSDRLELGQTAESRQRAMPLRVVSDLG